MSLERLESLRHDMKKCVRCLFGRRDERDGSGTPHHRGCDTQEIMLQSSSHSGTLFHY